MNNKTPQAASCQFKQHTIDESSLPLCCPLPEQQEWNAHPRVYLPIEKTGYYTCPYCGTVYRLNRSK